jgi:hypothetical protein
MEITAAWGAKDVLDAESWVEPSAEGAGFFTVILWNAH